MHENTRTKVIVCGLVRWLQKKSVAFKVWKHAVCFKMRTFSLEVSVARRWNLLSEIISATEQITSNKSSVTRFLEVTRKNPLWRWGWLLQRLNSSVDHPTLCCLLWLGDNGLLLGRETSNLNLTQEALKATQNKLLSSGISPYWKTISTVIKGELSRLISSKVTEQLLLQPPSFPSTFSPCSLVLTGPLFSLPSWGGVRQWNVIRSLRG